MPAALYIISASDPIHGIVDLLKVGTRQTRQAEYRDHQRHECARTHSNRYTRFAQIPWPRSEATADEEKADEDRCGKRDEGRDGRNGEKSSGRQWATKDQQCHEYTNNNVEPDCVDGGLCVFVHTLDPPRAGKAIIASVGVSDSRCRHLRGKVNVQNCVSARGILDLPYSPVPSRKPQ